MVDHLQVVDQLKVIEVQQLHLAANPPPRDAPRTWPPHGHRDRHLDQHSGWLAGNLVGTRLEEVAP